MKAPFIGCMFAGVLTIGYAAERVDSVDLVTVQDSIQTEHRPSTPAAVQPGPVDMQAEAERLRLEAQKLMQQADNLSKAADSVSQRITAQKRPESKEGRPFKEKVLAIRDTIHILTKEGATALLESFHLKKRTTRDRGYGGGIGVLVNCYAINLKRAKEALGKDDGASGLSFPIEGTYETFLMVGGLVYGGIGKGVRIGGGGMGGSRTYSVQHNDSVITADITVGMGGFLLEKCFVKKNWNLQFGGLLGGGSITIDKYARKSDNVITQQNSSTTNNTRDAGFMLIELHGGFTYSLLSWLHLGINCSTPFFISPDGFTSKDNIHITNGFFSLNPGVFFRIILGNIG